VLNRNTTTPNFCPNSPGCEASKHRWYGYVNRSDSTPVGCLDPRKPHEAPQIRARRNKQIASHQLDRAGAERLEPPDIFLVREAVVNESTEPAVRHFVADEEAFDFVAGNWFSAFQGWIVLRSVQSGLPA
jgi:hypothetical protein